MPGPIPKRDTERIRRNKPEVETSVVEMIGRVEPPALGLDDPHPIVYSFYYSLQESGQAKYYEPSDWEYARLTMHFLDRMLKSSNVNGNVLAVVNSMLGDLLVSEGQRRRVRVEIERETQQAQIIDAAALFRERFNRPAGSAA